MSEKMTLDELAGPSNRSLLLVHGRDFKPGYDAYLDISMAALRAGIERDYPDKSMDSTYCRNTLRGTAISVPRFSGSAAIPMTAISILATGAMR